MYKTKRCAILSTLLVVLLVASIAAMPTAPAQPNQPTVNSTANGGELSVTWSAAAGSQFYTIGWTNQAEYQEYQSAGREWLDAFHFVTIPARYTSHTIKDLEPGGSYYVIIGARTSRLGGEAPTWSPWSSLVATAGQHGEGFCPITGLPLPPGGYLSVGTATTDSDGFTYTPTSVTTQRTVRLDGDDYLAPAGNKWLKVCASVKNTFTQPYFFLPAYDYNIDTDAGIGFVWVDDGTTNWVDVGVIPAGATRSACDVWMIPDDAQTVIVAYNDFLEDPVLYKVDL